MRRKIFNKVSLTFLFALSAILLSSCGANSKKENNEISKNLPSWYLNPKENNAEFLYGVAEGFTMEEATRNSLAESAARLMVIISSESSMLRQSDNNSNYEEIRQKTRQSVEKINFLNYKTSRSSKIADRFYVEVQIEREPFLRDQKERVEILRKKITDIDEVSKNSNPIQRRLELMKIIAFGKELELKLRILAGAGSDIGLNKDLLKMAAYEKELSSLSSSVDFMIDENIPSDISSLITEGLNREGFKIAKKVSANSSKQILIKASTSESFAEIYGSKMLKLSINFKNITQDKIVASNAIEISGSSALDKEQSRKSAIENLRQQILKVGILEIIGIK